MMQQWILTNRKDINAGGLDLIHKTKRFNLYGTQDLLVMGDPVFLIDGWILPRQGDLFKYSTQAPQKLLPELYKNHGPDFIHHIKGNFILVMIQNDQFTVYTDRIGVRKCFHHINGNDADSGFIIANTLKAVTDTIEPVPDAENIAIRALMHYYVGGHTFLKDVHCSQGACKLSFKEKFLTESYWHSKSLLDIAPEAIDYHQFAFKFKSIVKLYLDYFKPGRVSVTLTGGLDSRTVLAALLAAETKPAVFTYGQPESGDAVTAKQIAETCNLEYFNYPYPQLTGDWFGQLAQDVTTKGNSIINIHRAHRLYAMKQGTGSFHENEMLMGGFLGGENIRGIYYDNLIVSEFLWKCLNRTGDTKKLITEILDRHYIDTTQVDIDVILQRLEQLPYFPKIQTTTDESNPNSGTFSQAEQFYTLYLLEAQHHHSQDLNLYRHFIKYPVPIFMDIDFLELLYRSRFDFRYINSRSNTLLKGIKGHELNCRLIAALAPQLADIPFLKRGYFTAREYLGNKWILLAKRAFRQFFAKGIVPNFPLESWMKDYVGSMLSGGDIDRVNGIYKLDQLREDFTGKEEYPPKEAFWQKYTMPIALSLANKEYLD